MLLLERDCPGAKGLGSFTGGWLQTCFLHRQVADPVRNTLKLGLEFGKRFLLPPAGFEDEGAYKGLWSCCNHLARRREKAFCEWS